MSKILIVGYGIVGSNLHKELSLLDLDIYDKYKNIDTRACNNYDLAFICVDTPLTPENNNDVSEVYNAINEQNAKIYVIKSTILPDTTNRIIRETGKKVIFSPEYYGGTQHCNNFEFDFTILGGDKKTCIEVQNILQHQYDARHIFRITDSKTAEVVKYMENSWLATKVSFMQEFFELCQKINIEYEDLRELFLLDPRVNKAHTFVYPETPYWDSHCLNKDVPSIAFKYNMELLKSVLSFNENQKKKHNKG